MLNRYKIKERREMMEAREKLKKETEADEIIRRLSGPTPQFINVNLDFPNQVWVKWSLYEEQKIGETEETCSGCRRDNASSTGTTNVS